MFEWVNNEHTMFAWMCDKEKCQGRLNFRTGDVRGMKVGANYDCPQKLYTQCSGNVNASRLKEFIGYGVAVGYGNAKAAIDN